MIEAHFLSKPERKALVLLCKSGKVEHRIARRANALLLLDRGMSCEAVVLGFLDDVSFHGSPGDLAEGAENLKALAEAARADHATRE